MARGWHCLHRRTEADTAGQTRLGCLGSVAAACSAWLAPWKRAGTARRRREFEAREACAMRRDVGEFAKKGNIAKDEGRAVSFPAANAASD